MDQITIPSAQWSEYLRLKAEASAIKKATDALVASWQIPEATEAMGTCNIPVVNGNGDLVGKVCYYHFSGSVTPPGWRKRIS